MYDCVNYCKSPVIVWWNSQRACGFAVLDTRFMKPDVCVDGYKAIMHMSVSIFGVIDA